MTIRREKAEPEQQGGIRREAPSRPFSAGNTVAAFAGAFNQPLIDVLDILGIAEQEGFMADKLDTNFQPGNQIEKDAAKAGEFVAHNLAALIPQLQAARIPQTASTALNPKLLDMVRETVLSTVRNNPMLTSALEEVSAATAGALGSEAEAVGAGPLGQLGAELAGGAAPGVVASKVPKTAAGLSRFLFKRFFSSEALDQKTKRDIGRAIREGLDAEGEQNLQQANQVFERLGVDGRPSIAEASGSPNLLARQRQIEEEASGATLNTLSRRKGKLTDEIINQNQYRPELSGREPDIVYDVATRRVEATQRNIETKIAEVQAQRGESAGALPRVDRGDAGENLRSQAQSLRQTVQAQFRERAEDIGLNNMDVEFPFTSFREGVKSVFSPERSRFLKGKLPKIVRRVAGDKGDTVRFDDLQSIRSTINDEMEKAAVSGDKRQMRELSEFRRMFDRYFDEVDPIPNGVSDDIADQWRSFRKDYKNDFIERFDKGTAYKIRARRKRGEYQVADERVADSFLVSESTVKDYFRLFGDDPSALAAIRSAVLDKARTVAVREGQLDHNALLRWSSKQHWLREMPQLDQELRGIASASRALASRESALRQRSVHVGRMKLSQITKMQPEQMIERAIKDQRFARFLVNTARRTDHQDALTASVWESAYKQLGVADGQQPNPARLRQWMLDNERSLRMMLSSRHFSALRDVYEAVSIVQRTPTPQGVASPVGPLEKLEEVTGTGVPQISSRIFAAQSGRVSYRYNAVDALARFFNRFTKNRQNALLTEALFDESLARDLAMAQGTSKIPKDLEQRLNGWLFTVGLPDLPDSRFIDVPGIGPQEILEPE